MEFKNRKAKRIGLVVFDEAWSTTGKVDAVGLKNPRKIVTEKQKPSDINWDEVSRKPK